jgi:RNA 3'-terminal phosphate cyclase (ATP)
MIYLDGSMGEGGGQILRSSLTLSALTGNPFCLYQIRANRPKSGLEAQHLTAVHAIAKICNAQLKGDHLNSMSLEFNPQTLPQGGKYQFDVTEARQGGSAGAMTLVLQTILLPLACADQDSEIILKGGTHVPFSPALTYIEHIYLPLIQQIGIEAKIELKSCGWYPRGGGEFIIKIKGQGQNLLQSLKGLKLRERGSLKQIKGVAIATNLPDHIPQRMALTATKLLKGYHPLTQIKPQILEGIASGAGIFLIAEYQNTIAGFSALGKQGLASEKVAELAVKDFVKYHKTKRAIDQHLADQLLLPLAFAQDESIYQVEKITQHLITNAEVIDQFGLAKIQLNHQDHTVSINAISSK